MSEAIAPELHSVWQRLQAMRSNLTHATLLYGASGEGKTNLAQYFAKSILCMNQKAKVPCNICRSCHLFELGHHPGMHQLHSEGGAIKIDMVRGLAATLHTTVTIGREKVIVINPLENLNHNAANAMLKLLEEPPPHTYFIAVSNNITGLLPTILSRFVKVAVNQSQAKTDRVDGQVLDDFIELMQPDADLLAISQRWQAIAESNLINELQQILHTLMREFCGLQSKSPGFKQLASYLNIATINYLFNEMCNMKQQLEIGNGLNHQYWLDALVVKLHFRGVL